MEKIRYKTQKMMTEKSENAFGFLLYLVSVVYGLAIRLRSLLYNKGIIKQKKLPCRVISIGNLAVGGTGKTPMTLYVAKMIKEFGLNPAIISRGYKGRMEKTGAIVSDGNKVFIGPEMAGDEPFMMAHALRGIPVIIGKDRFSAGMRAIHNFSTDVMVLDDGFQHRRLARDIDITLIDDNTFFGNGHLLPRGVLREPISALARAHAFVITRSNQNPSHRTESLSNMFPGKQIFSTVHLPYIHCVLEDGRPIYKDSRLSSDIIDFSFLKNENVFVFSGIARNQEFRKMVKEKVKTVAGFLEYPDHYRYTPKDLNNINYFAKELAVKYIITTEKDFSRLDSQIATSFHVVVMGVQISFGNDETRFRDFIRNRLA